MTDRTLLKTRKRVGVRPKSWWIPLLKDLNGERRLSSPAAQSDLKENHKDDGTRNDRQKEGSVEIYVLGPNMSQALGVSRAPWDIQINTEVKYVRVREKDKIKCLAFPL